MEQPGETDTALDTEADDGKRSEADTARLAEVHARAMRRFDSIANATRLQRELSLAARRFVAIPGAQWDGPWGEQFENSIKVEVNKVGRALRKIETDYRSNRTIPDFRPDGKDADPDTANMIDGLHRADSYRFKSQQARDNAFLESAAGGFGAYALTNEWEDEQDKDNDHQRVNPASIIVDADQSVFFDLDARLYDKSDAGFGFVRSEMSHEAYEGEYEGCSAAFPTASTFTWNMTNWFKPDTVAVAKYYEVEDADDTLWIATNRVSKEERRLWSSDIEKGTLAGLRADGWELRKQSRKRRRVHLYILSGSEVLEDRGLIVGQRIPIVPVYGQRFFVENVEWWKGCVQDKMDAQRLYNSNVSKLAETNSLSPREVPIFAAEQMPPHLATLWANMNIDRAPYALIEPLRDDNGTIVSAGPIGKVEPPTLAPVTATLLQIANTDLQEDMEDGADTVKANTSAEAMDIAASRVDAKSGIYLDNWRQSVECEGEIYLGMAAEVYTEEGREVETMSEDGDHEVATLKVSRTDASGLNGIANDLERGRYKVIASVTEATATRKDKTVRQMLNIAQVATAAQDQELVQAATLTAVLNMDGEGMDDFQKWARAKALGMGLVEPNDDEKAAMEQQAQQPAAPDPMADLATAQAKDFLASAGKKLAETDKVTADTALSKAKTVATLVDAHQTVNPPANDPHGPDNPAWSMKRPHIG